MAYSKGSWPRLFATTCQAVPPNQHATFYATFWQKRSISREISGSEPSYSGSFLRTGSHRAAPTPLPVSIRFGSGVALAAGFGLPHEPHARRHDRKAVEMGAEQAAKIGAIEGS